MNTPAHHEIGMGWNESVQDILDAYPEYSKDDIHQMEITPDGPIIVFKPNE